MPRDQGEAGRMDLLTVLEHEIGHLLDRDHEADGVMLGALTAGTRRTVSPALTEDMVGLSALTGFAWAEEEPWIGGH
jgi:hypothetical protein